MRCSIINLAAASCLLASVAAKCPDLMKTELAAVAACGNQDELAACFLAAESCIHGCMSAAGCTDEEASSFADWLANDCAESRIITGGDLRKREAAPAPQPAAHPQAAPAVTVVARQEGAVTVTEPAVTQTAPATPPLQKIVPLVCLTTEYHQTTICRKPPGAKTQQCEPTESAEVKCMPGLLCMRTEKGQEVCMVKKNAPILSGIIVTCCLSLFAASMLGWVIWAGCTSRAERRREMKQAEAKAIADGMKQEAPGGNSDAYLPLIHEPAAGMKGRVRDSSADPFGSGSSSRRPNRLGMTDGYGGVPPRSPDGSRAPSPLGVPGATEDISYGGRR